MRPGLSALRVVDLSTGIAGAYCTKLLADAGADVIKVEPPGGDPLRAWSAGGAVDPDDGGALFRFLHHGTRSILGTPGEAAVETLVDGADIVVESSIEEPFDAARSERAGIVWVSITPFGRAGPHAPRPASDLTVQAASGGLANRGRPEGRPVMAGGRTTAWLAGTFAAVAATAAGLRARRTGRGERVDVAISEAFTIAAGAYAEHRHRVGGNPPITEAPRKFETPSIEPTLDGYVGFCTNSRQQFADFLVLIERPDLEDDADLANARGRERRWDEWNATVHEWTTRYTTAEIVARASALRIPVAPVHDAAGVLAWDHLATRNVLVRDPADTFTMPRRPWRVDDEDPPPPTPSPRLGEHTGRIEVRDRARPPATGATELPLAGIRVLDLTAWWAGPIATGVMAALGADVVHVESVTRFDGMRALGGRHGLDGPWWERSSHFACANTNKRGITLDLTVPVGRDVLERLVTHADVVVENFTPRVLTNFGLGWHVIRALNPRAILCRMPAFGLDGPWRDNPGFAQTMEQVSGLAWLTGERDDQPRNQGGASDPNAGMHAVFAVLVALANREATGEGARLEVTMVEGALNAAAELLVEHTAYGINLARDGNRAPYAAPQGVYRCVGAEQWLALSVETDEQWCGLRRALDDPLWARDRGLASHAGRRGRHDELDERLTAWAAPRRLGEAVELLCHHGVPASEVRDPRAGYDNPQLQARGFYEVIDHPVLGSVPTPTVPFRYASVARWLRRPAPTLGQHTEEVLTEWLDISPDELATLATAGITGREPRGV